MTKKGPGNAIPEYLRGKYQLIGTVVFTALFSIVFLLVSIPFSHNAWFRLGNSIFFFFTLLFALGSLLLVILSKFVMYKTRTKIKMTYLGYVSWDVAEVIIICLAYTFLTVPITKIGWDQFPRILGNSLVYGTISIIIPYIIAGMYFAINDKNKTIRLLNYDNVVSDEALAPSQLEKVTLFDNGGVLRLSVNLDNLYYIESDDNYINVWYTDSKGELKRYMLRCRLKTVEESFRGSSLVRCHRKYIVNMQKVRILRKVKDGYELDLGNDAIKPIPISKTYSENVLSLFNNRS
ncbi:MAG: LytTR family transcriptional regulator [Bacteroidales bacterium]|nr:LytTR family transcriptional regulator [Bacteroidales bacterium]MDD7088213.1 LytTR family DNA-binding domain-containing protein [Bacteroidales bacterium]MDY2935416.1 LytTR family DNA-binding domain-containing protein [Candidatus Cryptobacteroides sp.]